MFSASFRCFKPGANHHASWQLCPPRTRPKIRVHQTAGNSSGLNVDSLRHMFGWMELPLDRLATALSSSQTHQQCMVQFANSFAALTLSTSFSGIGSPEHASLQFSCFFIHMLASLSGPGPTPTEYNMKHALWACEYDSSCVAELLCSQEPQP